MKIYPLSLFLSFLFPSCKQAAEFQQERLLPVWQPEQQLATAKIADIVFASADGGQTWQDVSAGVPIPVDAGFGGGKDDNGLSLTAGNGSYRGKRNANFPFWNKEINGKTWNRTQTGGGSKWVESGGVVLATCNRGIMRSVDDGKNWEPVISEGGVGIDVARIEGGFAAITYSSEAKSRRVRTSYDGGKTWQAIDAGLPPSMMISSVVQVDDFFFCGHPDGIYRSEDKGKTWQLIFPSLEGKVFNLKVTGKVIYAVPSAGGC